MSKIISLWTLWAVLFVAAVLIGMYVGLWLQAIICVPLFFTCFFATTETMTYAKGKK